MGIFPVGCDPAGFWVSHAKPAAAAVYVHLLPEPIPAQGIGLLGTAHKGASAMCEKCKELDDKIERYRRFTVDVPDKDFVERVNTLIKELEREKATLHPEDR